MSKQWLTWGVKMEGADKAASEVKKIENATKDTSEEMDGLKESSDGAFGMIDNMTGGMVSGFAGGVKGIKNAVIGMKSLRAAVIATGVGALVVAITALVMFFTKTKRGAEMLQVATAALGVIFDKVGDVLASMGEAMVNAFMSPQSALEAVNNYLSELWDWFKSIGNFIKSAFILHMLNLKKVFKEAAIAVKEFFGGDASELRAELATINDDIKQTTSELVEHGKDIVAPIKDAWDSVKEGVTKFVEEVSTAVDATIALEKRSIALRDKQRELSVAFAEQRAEIQELKMAGDDVTLSIEERLEATEKAAEIEQGLMDKRVANTREAIRIQKEQMALTESTAEDMDKLAELEIQLAQETQESLGIQTELLTKKNALVAEGVALAEAEEQAQREMLAKQMSVYEEGRFLMMDAYAQEMELLEMKLMEENEKKLFYLAQELANEEITQEEHDAKMLEIYEDSEKRTTAIRDKYRKMEADADKQERMQRQQNWNARFNMAKAGLTALINLNNAFAGETEAEQKKAFEKNKKYSKGIAVISTAQAVTNALTAGGNPIKLATGAQFVEAAIALATGIAQIATINKTQFQSSTPPPDTGGDLGGGLGGGSFDAGSAGGGAGDAGDIPGIDFGFLGGGAGSSIQAYVVSNQVNTQLQADQQLQDQTVL